MGSLRFILALSVVLVHTGGIERYNIAGGTVAVQIFYIISGFLMATILSGKYDPRRDILIFFQNRALRIYSVYWVCLIGAVILNTLLFDIGKSPWLNVVTRDWPFLSLSDKAALLFSTIFVFGLDSLNFLQLTNHGLVYSGHVLNSNVWRLHPIPPAWTLSLELCFYVTIPFLIRLRTSMLAAIAGLSLLARFAIYNVGYHFDPWTYRFFPFELALFLIGVISRRLYDAGVIKLVGPAQRWASLGFLIAIFFVQPLSVLFKRMGLSPDVSNWLYYAATLFVLPNLFSWTKSNSLDVRIGDLSYPLYVIHWPLISAYDGFFSGNSLLGTSIVRSLLCVFGSTALAWLVVISVERPIDALRQRNARANAHAKRSPSVSDGTS